MAYALSDAELDLSSLDTLGKAGHSDAGPRQDAAAGAAAQRSMSVEAALLPLAMTAPLQLSASAGAELPTTLGPTRASSSFSLLTGPGSGGATAGRGRGRRGSVSQREARRQGRLTGKG